MSTRDVGSYRLENRLGDGGMGTVYLARHPTLGTEVAIKELAPQLARDPEFRQRFIQEGQAQARLSHPYIVEVKDLIENDAGVFLIMEYMSGGSFEQVIEETSGPLDLDWALPRLRQALSALDHAHQKGVIHRDIKPSNILLDGLGNAKVTDFGIAIVLGNRRLTATGTSLGTPHYMSPEQISRPKKIDHRSDVYSMGVMLYEVLTGRLPFDDETPFNIHMAHVHEVPVPVREIHPSISPALEAVAMRALAKKPEERFSGCGALSRALEAAVSGAAPDDESSSAETPAPPAVEPPRGIPPTQIEAQPVSPEPVSPGPQAKAREAAPDPKPVEAPAPRKPPAAAGTTPELGGPVVKDRRLGFVVKFALLSALTQFFGLWLVFMGYEAYNDLPGYFVNWMIVAAQFTSGALLGLAQWLVLRRHMPLTTTWIMAMGWIRVGFSAIQAAGFHFNPFWFYGLVTFSVELVILALILRRHAGNLRWWYLLSLPGWLAALGVTRLTRPLLFNMDDFGSVQYYLGASTNSAIWMVVLSVFQGLALLRFTGKGEADPKPARSRLAWQLGITVVVLFFLALFQ